MGEAAKAIERLAEILKAEFSDLELDRKVLTAWQINPDELAQDLADRFETSRRKIEASQVRLLSRGIIEVPQEAVLSSN